MGLHARSEVAGNQHQVWHRSLRELLVTSEAIFAWSDCKQWGKESGRCARLPRIDHVPTFGQHSGNALDPRNSRRKSFDYGTESFHSVAHSLGIVRFEGSGQF